MTKPTLPNQPKESVVSQEEHWKRLTREGRNLSPREQEADESFRRMAYQSGTKIKWAEDFALDSGSADFQSKVTKPSASKER